MKTLHIQVVNKVATYQMRDGAIICGNDDYQVEFTFDAEWNEHEEKTARFIWNGQYFDQEFTGTTCPVPVLDNTESVVVGVYVGESAAEAILSTTRELIPCIRSIRCGKATESKATASNGTGENYTNEAKGYANNARVSANEAKASATAAKASANEAKGYAEALANAGGGSAALEWKPLEKREVSYQYKEDEYGEEVTDVNYSYVDPTPLINEGAGFYLVRGEMWGMTAIYFLEYTGSTSICIGSTVHSGANGSDTCSYIEISHNTIEIYEPDYVSIDQDELVERNGAIGMDVWSDSIWSYAKVW